MDDCNTDKKQKKKDKKVVNNIEVHPEMNEHVVFTFGRMNPPTIGHELLINEVLKIKSDHHRVYLSHSHDSKKNPLSYQDKVRYMKEAFGEVIHESEAKHVIEVMKELDKEFKNVTMVVGSDRLEEMETLLNKYNNKEYTFESIEVISCGDRDPDSNDVSGVSASKLREAAFDGDLEVFKMGLPKGLRDLSEEIIERTRTGMEIEEALNIQQRRKRAMAMRRNKNKIKMARKRSMNKMANTEKLQKRAKRAAREVVRAKVAGKQGENYAELSPSQKEIIDKKVATRKPMIDAIAKRMLPKVRKKEMERLANRRKPKNEEVLHEEYLEEAAIAITKSELQSFEKFIDRLFGKYDIDFDFTKHFHDRLNDDRNKPKIKLKELADLIKKIYIKKGNPLKNKKNAEVIVKDLQSDLNMPVIVKYDSNKDEVNIVAKTIMRKKNFHSPDEKVVYEMKEYSEYDLWEREAKTLGYKIETLQHPVYSEKKVFYANTMTGKFKGEFDPIKNVGSLN